MPIIKSLNFSGAQLSIWHITESVAELRGGLFGDEIEVCNRFKSESRQKEFAASRVMLHELFLDQEVEYTQQGAPRFKNLNRGLSISHSGDYAACLVSSNNKCALDIEFFNRDISRLIPKFLSSEEQQIIANEDSFIIAWCAKEAAFKFLQRERVDFIQDLKVVDFNSNYQTVNILAFSEQILQLNYYFFDDLVIVYII